MSSSHISYTPRPDTAPDAEIRTLANIYSFVISSHARKKGTRPGAPDDGTKVKEDSADVPSLPH